MPMTTSAGSASSAIQPSNWLVKGMFGKMKTFTGNPNANPVVTNSPMTFICVMEVETSAFIGVRIRVPNLDTAAIAGVKVAVQVGSNFPGNTDAHYYLTPDLPDNTGWIPCTFNGAASGILEPRLAAEAHSLTAFDFTPLKSVARVGGRESTTRAVVAVKIEYPAGAVLTGPINDVWSWRVDVAGQKHRPLRCGKMAVAGITTPSSFTIGGVSDENVVVPVVEYLSVNAGYQEMHVGDSTTEGTNGEVRGFGACAIATLAASTPERPFEYFNCGMHGMAPPVYGPAALAHLDFVRPHVLFYQPYSINNTPTGGMSAAVEAEDWNWTMQVIRAARRAGIPRIHLLEGLPVDPGFRNTGAGDQKRRDLNTLLAKFSGGATVVQGYAAPMTGTVNASGQTTLPAGASADSAHPNATKYGEMADKVAPYVVI